MLYLHHTNNSQTYMVFSDLFFLFVFIPLFALTYLLATFADRSADKGIAVAPQFRFRNAALVVFSLLFYAWGEPVYVFLMLVSVMINFFVGLRIDRSDGGKRQAALVVGLAANIAIIATFKYLGFFAGILTDFGLKVSVPEIALPIGISFYTFQSISYLVDVYRHESPVQRRFSDLLLYISMFPQLIAGPIVRYGTVAAEIHERRVTANDLSEGVYRFLLGLGKKVIVANQMGEIADQFLKNGFSDLTTAGAWVGLTAFALQIYYDFSGYSDMAIGLGRSVGFHFNENFRYPYCCTTITDFWRRWHISLGSFFRDYVYIPLGGNRRHQAFNILVVWFLTGMWHGASWNFILWGLYFGLIVMLEKYTVLKMVRFVPTVLLRLYSLFLVLVGWGVFYFDDMGKMVRFFEVFFFGNTTDGFDFAAENALTSRALLWLTALLFCMPLRTSAGRFFARLTKSAPYLQGFGGLTVRTTLSLVLLVVSVALLIGATNNAFIYTRF